MILTNRFPLLLARVKQASSVAAADDAFIYTKRATLPKSSRIFSINR
jgi:hypothetical protein